MSRELREITKQDILPQDQYLKERNNLKKKIISYKKNRRITLGPYAIFHFESYETMLLQIQEMLFIEKGGDNQLEDELNAYNPLVPKGKELIATLMFEIDNPLSRSEFLNKVGGIEEKAFIKINDQKINSIPEKDLDRTSTEGKASSVQFIHFNFTNQQILKFKDLKNDIFLGINHKLYNHTIQIPENIKKSLITDFN